MRVAWIDELQRTLMDSAKSQRGLNFLFLIFVLLSTACPTSPESDQTKEGGRSGVQKTPRFGAESERFDLTKIQFSSKLSPRKFVSDGKARRDEHPTHHKTKGKSTERPHVSPHAHGEAQWTRHA